MGAIDHWKIKVSQLTTNLDTTICTAVPHAGGGGMGGVRQGTGDAGRPGCPNTFQSFTFQKPRTLNDANGPSTSMQVSWRPSVLASWRPSVPASWRRGALVSWRPGCVS